MTKSTSFGNLCGRWPASSIDLPDCLPILGYGLLSTAPDQKQRPPAPRGDSAGSQIPLPAICANVLRVLDETGVRVRDLPAFGILQKMRFAVSEPDPTGGRAKAARLTPRGRKAPETRRQLLGSIEERWQARFGEDAIGTLRELLERLAAEAPPEQYPHGWRASAPKPATLPHYPMVLHRGGLPDGS